MKSPEHTVWSLQGSHNSSFRKYQCYNWGALLVMHHYIGMARSAIHQAPARHRRLSSYTSICTVQHNTVQYCYSTVQEPARNMRLSSYNLSSLQNMHRNIILLTILAVFVSQEEARHLDGRQFTFATMKKSAYAGRWNLVTIINNKPVPTPV